MVIDHTQQNGVTTARGQTACLLVPEDSRDVAEISVFEASPQVFDQFGLDFGRVDMTFRAHRLGKCLRPFTVSSADVGG
jgi:hypothetical protein